MCLVVIGYILITKSSKSSNQTKLWILTGNWESCDNKQSNII